MKKRKLKLVYQESSSDCGLACLSMIAEFYGITTSLSKLSIDYPKLSLGATVEDIITIATKVGLPAKAISVEDGELYLLRLPAIILWEDRHFVVLEKLEKNYAIIVDPASGREKFSRAIFESCYSGIAVIFSELKESRRDSRSNILLSSLVLRSAKPLQALVLASAYILFMLIVTFYFAVKIYLSVGVDFNSNYIVIGLSTLFLATIFSWLRNLSLFSISLLCGVRLTSTIVSELLLLPFCYFSTKSPFELSSWLRRIENDCCKALPLLLLSTVEIALLLACVLLMFFLSPFHTILLVMVTSCVFFLYSCVHFLKNSLFHMEWKFITPCNVAIIYTLREIKIFGIENAALSQWSKALKAKYIQVASETISQSIQILAQVSAAIVYVLSVRLFGNSSLGPAIDSYSLILGTLSIFLTANLLGSFLDRKYFFTLDQVIVGLSTFPKTELDIGEFSVNNPINSIKLSPTFLDSYQRANCFVTSEPLHFNRGEIVAISGGSDLLRSNLVGAILGKVDRTSALINGMSILEFGEANFLSQLTVVTNNDPILHGSIMLNIALRESTMNRIDWDRAVRLTQICDLYEFIEKLPMQYDTVLGTYESILTHSQLVRLFLCRALFRRPRVLVLDMCISSVDNHILENIFYYLRSKDIIAIYTTNSSEQECLANKVISVRQNLEILE